ncbi:protein kinase [Actinoplanes sp. NPDC051861]|uniref:protein kinase domain-containing protein n=1 Tax=Actinoplanes sp. NPDC051861 TaxID=3155170 RepID=UPI0034284E76
MAGIDTPAGYTRLERMSTGPEGDVYQAWDEHAGRHVALKLFHRYAGGRAEEASFAAYCAVAVGLGRHPSIVPVRYGGITATGRPWLVLDLIEGGTLAEAMRGDSPPAPADALRIAIALADAMAWAHSLRPPVAYGRLRPDHILLDPSGAPMLADFVAPLVTTSASPAADVVALGTLLFQMLTGNPWPGVPERDDPLVAAWPGLTRLLDQVVAPIPQVGTMTEFAARLREVRAGLTADAPGVPPEDHHDQ